MKFFNFVQQPSFFTVSASVLLRQSPRDKMASTIENGTSRICAR